MINQEKNSEILRRHYANMLDEIIKLNKNKWIKCSERLPKEEGYYLVYLKNYPITYRDQQKLIISTSYYDPRWGHEGWIKYNECHDRIGDYISHWQPLPEPPE